MYIKKGIAMLKLLIILMVLMSLFFLYVIMIAPRVFGRPGYEPFLGHLYAHRGLHDNNTEAVENSVPAFRRAVENGFGIEADVRLTKDGKLVVFHDETLTRLARKEDENGKRFKVYGKVSDYDFEELKSFFLLDSNERIPGFDEFLNEVSGKVPLIIEIKEERINNEICSLVDKKLSGYNGIYCIESFNPLVLLWYRLKRRQILRGQLAEVFYRSSIDGTGRFKLFILAHLMLNFIGKPDFIAYNHKHSWEISFNICRRLFKSLTAAWTIKSADDLIRGSSKFDIFIFDSFIPDQKLLTKYAQKTLTNS